MSTLALELIAENKASRNPFLDLGNCGLTELPQELAELTHLEVLILADEAYIWNEAEQEYKQYESQNIEEANHLSNINLLAGLSQLKELYCHGTDDEKWTIQDISFLARLTNLTTLTISNNQIQDISSLAQLTNLTRLEINSNQIQDISSLAQLTNLTRLEINSNQIQDIRPLAQLTNLTTLTISNNQIQDISPLAQLTNLTMLVIYYNQIQDISPLAQLTNLAMLFTDHYLIQNINSISELTNSTTD